MSHLRAMELSSEEEALFVAISFGKIHRITSLLSKIDNLDIRNSDQMTPLIHVCVVANAELCSHMARLLLKEKTCDINAQDVDGRTALMHSCRFLEKSDAVRILVRHKHCNPNMADEAGWTALMHAVAFGNLQAMEILLSSKKQVTVNAVNMEGTTALDLALKVKNKSCCEFLVNVAGADVSNVQDVAVLNSLLKDTS